jgi:DNA-binding transcriptional LysR family regulator
MRHLRTLAYISDVARSGSIRRTAERMNITPSALTRKIQDFEDEIGMPIFERLSHGMRLNSAGELIVQHARKQASDLERVRSQIADIQGVRRGHVGIACSQAFVHADLPHEIQRYRAQHPLVSFSVQVRDHAHAISALTEYDADLALILQPPPAAEFQPLLSYDMSLCAMMAAGHPLAGQGPVRLRDCLRHPIALPDQTLAMRHVLDAALAVLSMGMNVAVESGSAEFLRNYIRREHAISFQVSTGIPAGETDLCARELDRRDVPPLQAVLGCLRGRALSVAAAKFANQLSDSLHRRAAS